MESKVMDPWCLLEEMAAFPFQAALGLFKFKKEPMNQPQTLPVLEKRQCQQGVLWENGSGGIWSRPLKYVSLQKIFLMG